MSNFCNMITIYVSVRKCFNCYYPIVEMSWKDSEKSKKKNLIQKPSYFIMNTVFESILESVDTLKAYERPLHSSGGIVAKNLLNIHKV